MLLNTSQQSPVPESLSDLGVSNQHVPSALLRGVVCPRVFPFPKSLDFWAQKPKKCCSLLLVSPVSLIDGGRKREDKDLTYDLKMVPQILNPVICICALSLLMTKNTLRTKSCLIFHPYALLRFFTQESRPGKFTNIKQN